MRRTQNSPALAFQTAGDVGPRVLLIMGFGMRGIVWTPQIEELREDHRLAWFDNRGIGESDLTTGSFRMADLAKDARSIADAAGWSDFHVVGVSLGGMIAQELALLEPRRLLSLTLIATHPGGPLGLAPTGKGLPLWLRAAFGPEKDRVEQLTHLLYTDSFLRTVDRAQLDARMKLQTGKKPPRDTALRQLLAVARHDTRKRLPSIQVPTLVIKPESDILVRPFHSDVLARGIPKARLLSLPDVGHGITFQRAADVNRAIREHVAMHDA